MPRVTTVRPSETKATLTLETPAAPKPASSVEDQPKLSFWERLQRITAIEWGRDYVVYLYRESPKVRIAGQGGYLCKLAQPFSPEDVKARYGGGTFKAMLNRGAELIATETFEVEGLPIYDITRENPNGAPGGPNGASAAGVTELLQIVKDQLKTANEELAALRARGEQVNPGTERALDLLGAAYKKATEIQIGGQEDQTAQLKSLLELLTAFGFNPRQNNGVNSSREDMIFKVLLDRALAPPPPAPNPLDGLNTMLAIFEKIDALRAPRGDGHTTWADVGREVLKEHGGELVQTLGQFATRVVQAPPRYAPRPPQQQPSARPNANPAQTAAPPRRATGMGFPGRPLDEAAPASAPSGAPTRTPQSSSGFNLSPMDEAPGTAPEWTQGAPPATADVVKQAEEMHMAVVRGAIVGHVLRCNEEDAIDDCADLILDVLRSMWPEGLTYLEKFSQQQIENYFRNDPILAQAARSQFFSAILQSAREGAIEEARANAAPATELVQ